MPRSASASFAWLLDTHSSGRIGLPSVVDSSSPRKLFNSVGSVRASAGRRPRTLEGARSRACRSFRPRLIVLRASLVARGWRDAMGREPDEQMFFGGDREYPQRGK
jgi:hypothetical protein